MSRLNLYQIFHLNLIYSSIPADDRAQVIARCYWPLLEVAETMQIPLGIELSGVTLEIINELDPAWVQKFKHLLAARKVELLGSGYAQIIGPLVPAAVNDWNQKLGLATYVKLLGVRPTLAWINEQAFSADMIKHYLAHGYQALVMEWNNPARFHPTWPGEWRYHPQVAVDGARNKIALIWNNSIWFQKFQRYAQGEDILNEYVDFLSHHVGDTERHCALYGSDAEIFDYRPGRYGTEMGIDDGDWPRIKLLFHRLKEDSRFSLILPSQVMGKNDRTVCGNPIMLDSAEEPIPVKKQEKYNICRWAVTGRNSPEINARCFRLHDILLERQISDPAAWRQLCFFWSSDFRTHIEEKRWQIFLTELAEFEKRWISDVKYAEQSITFGALNDRFRVTRQNAKLIVESTGLKIQLNCRKGLAIDALTFKAVDERPLIGTLPHGYYEDISYGADFFSGHTTMEIPGRPKMADLASIDPTVEVVVIGDERSIVISGQITTPIGKISKKIILFADRPRVKIIFSFDFFSLPPLSLRTGITTLLPTAFARSSLYYETTNGGSEPRRFNIGNTEIDHGRSISAIVSAAHCLGATDGKITVGDKDKAIIIETDKAAVYSAPMIKLQAVDDSYFFRVLFSLREIDETCRQTENFQKAVQFTISAVKSVI